MIRSFLRKKISLSVRGIIGYLVDHIEKIPLIPNFIEKKTIGKTVNNIPINCYLIGSGKNKILFVSAIHGNEVGTVKLIHHCVNYLEDRNDLKSRFTFYLIPCLNIDGYHQALKHPDYFNGGNIGRFNANNVDLNRNFNTLSFKKESVHSFGKNYKEKEKVYCGEYGNSEPETKGLVNFIKKEGIKVLFAFHNIGRDVMGNNLNLSQDLIKIYSKKCGFRIIDDKEWVKLEQTGTLKEWCEINNIVYIETEGSTRWGSDWKIQKDAIISTILALQETEIE